MIEQGGAAEAEIDGVNEKIHSVTDSVIVVVADRFPRGEMAVEQWHINYIFIDLRGRDSTGRNREFVPPRRAFLHPRTDVSG